jgi:hypothetical protein
MTQPMMTATGKLQALEISRNGRAITVLDHHKSSFTLNGQSYRVRPSGTFARRYELRRGDEMLAFAKSVPFFNGVNVTCGEKPWVLKGETFRNTRFGLYDGATRIGGIAAVDGIPGSLFSSWNGATVDMPDALPLETQLFLLSIVLFRWDEANSAD